MTPCSTNNCDKHAHNLFGHIHILCVYIGDILNKTITPLTLVGHKITTAESRLHASSTIYHVMFNMCS